MLFNGWGITPAGSSVAISDLALKLVIAPDKKTVIAVSGGFTNTGLTLLDISGRHVTQFLPLAEAWNGLAFSKDGRRIFVSGGDSGQVHAFSYADGTAQPSWAINAHDVHRPRTGSDRHVAKGLRYNSNSGASK